MSPGRWLPGQSSRGHSPQCNRQGRGPGVAVLGTKRTSCVALSAWDRGHCLGWVLCREEPQRPAVGLSHTHGSKDTQTSCPKGTAGIGSDVRAALRPWVLCHHPRRTAGAADAVGEEEGGSSLQREAAPWETQALGMGPGQSLGCNLPLSLPPSPHSHMQSVAGRRALSMVLKTQPGASRPCRGG